MILPSLPASKAVDWGCAVTVCIAVLNSNGKSIVQVSDHKVSFGTEFSADYSAMKDVPFFGEYCALIAGDDVEHATPILKRAKEILCAKPLDVSPITVANAVDDAYGERLRQEISSKVLRKRGFTVESFLEKGKHKCTPSVYLNLCNRIDQVKLSLKFLVCGFDDKGQGHIFTVDGESAPKCYDDIGMWAIGDGAPAALSSLAFHKNNLDFEIGGTEEEAVYFALAAKFMAESSGSVGNATFISVHNPASPVKYINLLDVQMMRKMWEDEGCPRCPKNLGARVKGVVKTLAESEQMAIIAAVAEKIKKEPTL